jgi:hypothetical protein
VKKNIDPIALVLFLMALASFLAAAKGGGHNGFGFFNGG